MAGERKMGGGAPERVQNVTLPRESILVVREALLSIVDVLERVAGLPRTSDLRRTERRAGPR